MAIDESAPRSRRALLAAAAAGAVALTAERLVRPLAVSAVDGEAVLLGTDNFATTATGINGAGLHVSAPGQIEGIYAEADGNGVHGFSEAGTGVYGDSNSYYGVHGRSGSDTGVAGESTEGSGVSGESGSGWGVYGGGTIGVYGWSDAKAGVIGIATVLAQDVLYPDKTGVYGYAPADSACRGVHGRAVAGRGVYGQATTGQGVRGDSTTGYGVRGYATTGTAVYASSADPMAGCALRAAGRVKLDNCAGVATITSGTKSVVVTPGIDLASTSAVVATLLGNAGAVTTTVSRCVVNATTNTFTIYLTANSTANVKVAWHVFG